MSESQAALPLPRYQCHKEVWALKIGQVIQCQVHEGRPRGGVIVPLDEGYHPFTVSQQYMDRHQPVAGGYYVCYSDGYQSFSPAEAFESGYKRI